MLYDCFYRFIQPPVLITLKVLTAVLSCFSDTWQSCNLQSKCTTTLSATFSLLIHKVLMTHVT